MEKTSNSAKRIKELMEFYQITQADLSRKTGIAKSAISQYVSGVREPRQDKIAIICDCYKVEPAWLMGLDVPMFTASRDIEDLALQDVELLEKFHRLRTKQKQTVMNLINCLLEE